MLHFGSNIEASKENIPISTKRTVNSISSSMQTQQPNQTPIVAPISLDKERE